MQKALSLAVAARPIGLLWPLVGLDMGLALLVWFHGLPAAAVQAVQLFLRF